MAARKSSTKRRRKLPAILRPLFWDFDFAALAWDQDRDLVIGRVLASGTWDNITWLRKQVGNDALRDWILRRRGSGLTVKQLRFWEVVLRLPRGQVDAWLKEPGRATWDRRARS